MLIAGRENSTGVLASAELYVPNGATFTATGTLLIPRAGHTAVALGGAVLVAGGQGAGFLPGHTEVFDPAPATFSPTGALQLARLAHAMTALGASGQVLVTGGSGTGQGLNSAELYR